jgi:hypothetical protein
VLSPGRCCSLMGVGRLVERTELRSLVGPVFLLLLVHTCAP